MLEEGLSCNIEMSQLLRGFPHIQIEPYHSFFVSPIVGLATMKLLRMLDYSPHEVDWQLFNCILAGNIFSQIRALDGLASLINGSTGLLWVLLIIHSKLKACVKGKKCFGFHFERLEKHIEMVGKIVFLSCFKDKDTIITETVTKKNVTVTTEKKINNPYLSCSVSGTEVYGAGYGITGVIYMLLKGI